MCIVPVFHLKNYATSLQELFLEKHYLSTDGDQEFIWIFVSLRIHFIFRGTMSFQCTLKFLASQLQRWPKWPFTKCSEIQNFIGCCLVVEGGGTSKYLIFCLFFWKKKNLDKWVHFRMKNRTPVPGCLLNNIHFSWMKSHCGLKILIFFQVLCLSKLGSFWRPFHVFRVWYLMGLTYM